MGKVRRRGEYPGKLRSHGDAVILEADTRARSERLLVAQEHTGSRHP